MTSQSTWRGVALVCGPSNSAVLMVLVISAMLQSAQQTNTDQTPHLSLTGDRFVTITEGEDLTLTCNMTSPTPNVATYWYLQFRNLNYLVDTDTVPYHYDGINFKKKQEGQTFSVTIQGLSAGLGHVMVQCSALATNRIERFSKGMFMIYIVSLDSGVMEPNPAPVEPDHRPVECCQTSCINISDTEAQSEEKNTRNCSSVQDQVLQLTILTMVVSTCLIINTITLFMVVTVLCRLRKREPHNPLTGKHDKRRGKDGDKEQNDEQ